MAAGPAANNGAMDTLRPADLAARVVAWHNRHPLARRITPSQVGGIGAVGLPFALREPDPDGAQPAQTPADALRPIFDRGWMFGADPRRLDDFAVRHGAYPLDDAAHWPWRHIDANVARAHAADAEGLEGRTARHLLTAVIDADGGRVRVLVGPQADLSKAAVFGRRIFSRPRLGAAGGLLAAVAGTLAAVVVGLADGDVPTPQLAAAATAASAPMASGAAHGVVVAEAGTAGPHDAGHGEGHEAPRDAADAHGAEPAPTPDTHDAHDAPTEDPHAAHAETPTEAPPADPHGAAPPVERHAVAIVSADYKPVDVEPMLQDAAAAGPLVRIRPNFTEDERRQARLVAEAARPPKVDPIAAMKAGTVYALATPALRTRDDAQAQQVLLQSLKAQVATPVPTHLDLMPTGRRWRVVWWPHPEQAEAERLRVEARARGLDLELIAF